MHLENSVYCLRSGDCHCAVLNLTSTIFIYNAPFHNKIFLGYPISASVYTHCKRSIVLNSVWLYLIFKLCNQQKHSFENVNDEKREETEKCWQPWYDRVLKAKKYYFTGCHCWQITTTTCNHTVDRFFFFSCLFFHKSEQFFNKIF